MVALLTAVAGVVSAGALETVSDTRYPLAFPVMGEVNYTDTWGAPRSEGRTHQGADIFAPKGTPVVAAAGGTVTRMTVGERAGRYIVLEHHDGWRSYYLHLDNDTPGTDDGLAGGPAPGIAVGVKVSAGDVLDYVGDSGNAEETPSHLHFELHRPDGTAINPTPHLDAARTGVEVVAPAGIEWAPNTVPPPNYSAINTELVGHFDPGHGFNAGLFVHNQVAYLGTWGRREACPGSGVHLIDVADPTNPTALGALASAEGFRGTSTDSVWVGSVDNEWFTGEIAAVAVRLCDTGERNRWSSAFRGLALYDVTDAANPQLLSVFDTGARTQGANEVTGAVRADGRLVIGATVMQSYLHTEGELGDFRLIDATNPTEPRALSDWDQRRTVPELNPESLEAPTEYHVHSARFTADGMNVWLAAWDGGAVLLDIEQPTDPVVEVQLPVTPGSGGNAHSVVYDESARLVIRSDEDLNPLGGDNDPAGWGSQTIYDATDLRAVQQTGTYSSPGAGAADQEPSFSGFFSVHEAEVVDGIEYVSAYSDGLRIVDLADPTNPVELGSFVPPAAVDPHGYWKAYDGSRSFPLVWGVETDGDLIFLSDVNTGLWIVRRTSSERETENDDAPQGME